jgi:hypothetical protein
LKAPNEIFQIRYSMVWHPRFDSDLLHSWIRDPSVPNFPPSCSVARIGNCCNHGGLAIFGAARRWHQTPDRIPAEEMGAKIEAMVKPILLTASV